MLNQHLELVCGDPEGICSNKINGGEIHVKNPVSFTRFVFPFAYKKNNSVKVPASDLYYKKCEYSGLDDEIFQQRLKYFTKETRKCMYERAAWFQIPKDKWEQTPWGREEGVIFQNTFTGCKFKIRMSTPLLVLFEWEGNTDSDSKDEKENFHDILQTGFLICEVWFPDGRYLVDEKSGGRDEKTEKASSKGKTKKGACKGKKIIFDDLLYLNELFRCFDYPNYEEHWKKYKTAMANVPTDYPKGPTIQELLKPSEDKKDENKKDKDEAKTRIRAYFDRWCNLLTIPVKDGDGYYQIVSEDSCEQALASLVKADSKDTTEDDPLLIYGDYRAFVWSAAVLKEGGKSVARPFRTSQQDPAEFGHWIKFLNVDPPSDSSPISTGYSSQFEKEWARKRTYYRWVHFGTWYGFNYHAGVAVMSDKEDGKKSIYLTYFRYLYFDIILLLFYLRVTLFRFSNALTQIAQKEKGWRQKFVYLRRAFNKFTILYQFPLLSNQQQAIEMYDLARKHFDIDDFYAETKSEIDDTHEYLETVRANQLSEVGNKLANIGNAIAIFGIPLAVAGVIASLFSMDVEHLHVWEYLNTGFGFRPNWEFWTLFFIVIFGAGISWLFIKWWLKRQNIIDN